VYTHFLLWEPLRTFNSATLTGGFDEFGDPLDNPAYIVKMVNNSDTDVTVSIDGSNPVDICPANTFFLYDETKWEKGFPVVLDGTQFYISGAAGTGNIYLVIQYIKII